MARSVLFCEHRDLSCCARPGDLCSGASPGTSYFLFQGDNGQSVGTCFLQIHVPNIQGTYPDRRAFKSYCDVTKYELKWISKTNYCDQKTFFFQVDRPKLARRFFRLLFSGNLACVANPPLPPQRLGEPLPVHGEPSRAPRRTLH